MSGPAADPSFTFQPLLAFAVSAPATPGPNNIMMLTAAAAHDMRRKLPQLAGVAIGFGPLIGLVFTLMSVPCVGGCGLIGSNGKRLLNHPA